MYKNTDKQKELDNLKWRISEEFNTDMSGYMPYCDFCHHKVNGEQKPTCLASQENRIADSLCAKAYRKLRKNRDNIWVK
jgi:hypothetical protein